MSVCLDPVCPLKSRTAYLFLWLPVRFLPYHHGGYRWERRVDPAFHGRAYGHVETEENCKAQRFDEPSSGTVAVSSLGLHFRIFHQAPGLHQAPENLVERGEFLQGRPADAAGLLPGGELPHTEAPVERPLGLGEQGAQYGGVRA